MQKTYGSLCTGFGYLTRRASIAILVGFRPYLGPPIPAADIVGRLLGTKVSQNCMGLINDYSHKAVVFVYHPWYKLVHLGVRRHYDEISRSQFLRIIGHDGIPS